MRLGRAQGADHRFRPGVAESDLLERRDSPAQGLRHLHFELGRTIEARPAGRLHAHRLDHRGVRVPQDQGGVVVHEVEQLVAVHVVDECALPALQVHRKGAEVDAGAGVAARHRALRLLEERLRASAALDVALNQVVQPPRHALSFQAQHLTRTGFGNSIWHPSRNGGRSLAFADVDSRFRGNDGRWPSSFPRKRESIGQPVEVRARASRTRHARR